MISSIIHCFLTGFNKVHVGRSSKWTEVRARHLSNHPVCEACGGIDHLEVHHIEPFHINPSLELVDDNLITLCEAPSRLCHFIWGHFYNWKRINPNVVKDVNKWKKSLDSAKNIDNK